MNKIDQRFSALAETRKAALMPYLTLGYPEVESAAEIVPALIEAGADILELGVPFSDPVADGPVIQASSQRALENGMTLTRALAQIKKLAMVESGPPIVLMTYTNVLMNHGFDTFANAASDAGISGVIVPDMPLEESTELRAALEEKGIYLIYMVTPNLSDSRIAAIARVAKGFIYMVSVLGITGERKELPDISGFAVRIRRHCTIPIALGFGISMPQQLTALQEHVDGVIIGSALIRAAADPSHCSQDAKAFLQPFSAQLAEAAHV